MENATVRNEVFGVHKNTMVAVLDYLSKCPFREVRDLIVALENSPTVMVVDQPQKPQEEVKQNADKGPDPK